MSGNIFKLPCGIKQNDGVLAHEIELRPMTGEDEDVLVDARTTGKTKRLVRDETQRITEILSRCTVRIGTEMRPADMNPDSPQAHKFFERHWLQATISDRGFAVIRLRQISLDDIFEFNGTCYACKKELEKITINLDTLKVTYMNPELLKKETLSFTTSGGKENKPVKVTWKLLRGEDQPVLQEIIETRKADVLTALFQLRLLTINGEKADLNTIRKMRTKDRQEIRSEFDTAEGGIDTTVYYRCDNPKCETELEMKLPVGSTGFFFPSENKSRSSPIYASSHRLGEPTPAPHSSYLRVVENDLSAGSESTTR